MSIYILIFLIAVVLYLVTIEVNEQSKFLLGIYLTGLSLFVGCADMLGGYDRYIYGQVFDQLAITIQNDGDLLNTSGYRLFPTEWGYLGLNQLIDICLFLLQLVLYTHYSLFLLRAIVATILLL